jgi:Leucine-rich repeat (LRR) protein
MLKRCFVLLTATLPLLFLGLAQHIDPHHCLPEASVIIPDERIWRQILEDYNWEERKQGVIPCSVLSEVKELFIGDNPWLLHEPFNFSGLEYLTNLESLEFQITSIKSLPNPELLRNLSRLQRFNLRIQPFKYNTSSIYKEPCFVANEYPPPNLESLKNYPMITSLKLTEQRLTDLSALTALSNLLELDITCNSVNNLGPISHLTHLQSLNLSENSISSIEPLENLTQLIGLNLEGNCIVSLKPLQYLVNLQSLTITNDSNSTADCWLEDFGPLSKLTQLNYLAIRDTNFTNRDVQYLSSFDGLKTLELQRNNITNLEPFVRLWQQGFPLYQIDLSGNNISSLEPLLSIPLPSETLLKLSYNCLAFRSDPNDPESQTDLQFYDEQAIDVIHLTQIGKDKIDTGNYSEDNGKTKPKCFTQVPSVWFPRQIPTFYPMQYQIGE